MNTMQKVIKYGAMAFAVMLSISIFTAIAAVLTGISSDGTVTLFGESDQEVVGFTKTFDGVEKLELHNYSGKMTIQIGDTFTVEAKNVTSNYIAEVNGTTLYVGDENPVHIVLSFGNLFNGYNKSEIIVTIPADFVAETAEIENGSGNINIEYLMTKYLSLDNGSGELTASDVTADRAELDFGSGPVELTSFRSDRTELETGSGPVTMNQCALQDLTCDTNSGRFAFDGVLTGDSEFETGSGNVVLNITADSEDYALDCDAGSGGIWIDGTKEDNYRNKNKAAANSIEIDGGSGRVTLDFNK